MKTCRTVNGILRAIDENIPATLKVYATASGMDTGIWGMSEGSVILNLGGGRYSHCSKEEYEKIKGRLTILPC